VLDEAFSIDGGNLLRFHHSPLLQAMHPTIAVKPSKTTLAVDPHV
jgi:hypothetical protein